MATAAAHRSAMAAPAPGVPGNGMRIIGIILSAGGALFAISPLIIVAIGCAGASDSSCGDGAIVMIFTVPFGGLIAAVGAVLLAIGTSRRNKSLAAARSAMVSGAPDAYPLGDGTTTLGSHPVATRIRPSRPVPSIRTGQIFIGAAIALFALGVFINPHRGANAQGFYSAVSPIDCWWLAAICAVVGTFVLRAHSGDYSPERFRGRTLLWCGVVVLSWNFLILLLMGLGAGIGEYVNQAFDPGDGEGFSLLGIVTGTGYGPYMSIFPGTILGLLMMLRGLRYSKVSRT